MENAESIRERSGIVFVILCGHWDSVKKQAYDDAVLFEKHDKLEAYPTLNQQSASRRLCIRSAPAASALPLTNLKSDGVR